MRFLFAVIAKMSHHPPLVSKFPVPKSKAKAKTPTTKVITKNKGKYGCAKDGMKYCRPCGQHHPRDEFPEGSANCCLMKSVIQNSKTASISQGMDQWWEETYGDEGKIQRACQAYLANCPKQPSGGRRAAGGFKIMRHIEECRLEERLLLTVCTK